MADLDNILKPPQYLTQSGYFAWQDHTNEAITALRAAHLLREQMRENSVVTILDAAMVESWRAEWAGIKRRVDEAVAALSTVECGEPIFRPSSPPTALRTPFVGKRRD